MTAGRPPRLLGKVLVLLSGTALGQAIPVLAAPLLARMYSPEDFGGFGIYSSVLAVSMVAACLRYEHAILLEKDQDAAARLGILCGLLTLAVATAVFLATLVAPFDFLDQFPAGRIRLAVPLAIGLALTGMSQVGAMFCLKREKFGVVARGRVVQAALSTALSLGLGTLQPGGEGLVWAAVAGQAALLLMLVRASGLPIRYAMDMRGLLQTASLLARHRKFPLFTVPADLMSALAANLPVFYVTARHGPALAGAYVLAQRVLGAPLAILGSALMDAYKQSAAALHNSGTGFRRLSLKTSLYLLALLVPGGALAYFATPPVVNWVFGPEWAASSQFIQILLPALLLRLAATPVSYNFYLRGRQLEDLLAQTGGLIAGLAVFEYSAHAGLDAFTSLALYSFVLCMFYLYYLVRSNWLP